jgi:hypothetical protein
MIGATDVFSEIFGSVPEGDIAWNAKVAKAAIRAGFGVVLTYPGDKVAACTLTTQQAQKANIEAQDAAKAAGNLGWEKVIHPCGIAHVITDEKDLNKVGAKKLLADGANVALAPGTGGTRIVAADLDTSKEVETFRALWVANGGSPGVGLTVATPGVFRGTWVHKDGGHVWFTVPDGIELPDKKGRFSWCECHGFKVNIPNPDDPKRLIACKYSFAFYWASGYLLVPPSVRSEGAYRLVGEAQTLPTWLVDMAHESVAGHRPEGSEGILGRFEEDPIDTWSQEMSWGDILTGDGFTPAGHDNCGCPTYTRPGDATHSKSVTAHEPGCSLSWPDVSTGHLPMHIWSDALGGGRTMSKLSWITESRFGGDVRAAMSTLGIQRLHSGPDLSLDLEMYDPKSPTPEINGGNSETGQRDVTVQPRKSNLEIWMETDEYRKDLGEEIARQFLRSKATKYIREMEVRQSWTPPDDEDDFSIRLLNPPQGLQYAIEDVLPMRGNAMLSAQFKAGKTTFIMECIRALCDGEPFLGRFNVNTSGRVAFWQYELDEGMMDNWLIDVQLNNPQNLRVLNLRGKRIPLDTEYGQRWAIEWLRQREIRTWIIDPAVKAMIGWGDENDNTAVTLFTDMLDEIKEKAGVSELIIAHHTGRGEMVQGEERARGAARWDDWPDSRWLLTRMVGSDTRFIRMTGRGNDVPESALSYEPQRRRVSLVGGGDPLAGATRATAGEQALRQRILDHVAANPGLGKNQIMNALGIKSQSAAGPAFSALISTGQLYTTDGPNRSKLHFLGPKPTGEIESSSAVGEIEA